MMFGLHANTLAKLQPLSSGFFQFIFRLSGGAVVGFFAAEFAGLAVAPGDDVPGTVGEGLGFAGGGFYSQGRNAAKTA
jgi:hypothetical protein